MKTIINWKVFWILWIAATASVVLVLPYVLQLESSALDPSKLPLPLPVVIVIQIIQTAILLAIAIFVGLLLATRIGLGTPILDSMTRGESVADKIRAVLPISVLLGIFGTFVILGLEILYFRPALLKEFGDAAKSVSLQTQPAAWKGLLASFYGGIAEEILMRLFLMSVLAWLGTFISRTSAGKPTSAAVWTANILAAILFGLGHLPATVLHVPLTPLVITHAVVQNGVLGILFGWLYWKRGLESAMISHFSADLVLHVLLALVRG